MLLWIFLAVVALIALLLIYGLLQPAAFNVMRQADYAAKPAEVFAQISDFHNWTVWSPWDKMDPDMKRSFSGAASGVGAKYAWIGNRKVGEGNMEITDSEASKRLQLDLHFLKPFQADNITEFTLTPNGNQTNLRWEMRGQRPFMFRVLGFIFKMDKIVGADFEKGLINLRGVVEK